MRDDLGADLDELSLRLVAEARVEPLHGDPSDTFDVTLTLDQLLRLVKKFQSVIHRHVRAHYLSTSCLLSTAPDFKNLISTFSIFCRSAFSFIPMNAPDWIIGCLNQNFSLWSRSRLAMRSPCPTYTGRSLISYRTALTR